MDGVALRRFKISTGRNRATTYQAGEVLSLPDAQFTDLAKVGLVSPAKEKVKRAEMPKTELPNPGNTPLNNGAE